MQKNTVQAIYYIQCQFRLRCTFRMEDFEGKPVVSNVSWFSPELLTHIPEEGQWGQLL